MYSKASMVEIVWNPIPKTTYIDIYNMYSIGYNKLRMSTDFNIYNRDKFYPLKKLYIRNRTFWAPKNSELILNGSYSNWKTPTRWWQSVGVGKKYKNARPKKRL